MSYWVVKAVNEKDWLYLCAPGVGSCWGRTNREARAFKTKVQAQGAIDATAPDAKVEMRPVRVLTREDVHRREVMRLRRALQRIADQEQTDRPWTNPRIIAREALSESAEQEKR